MLTALIIFALVVILLVKGAKIFKAQIEKADQEKTNTLDSTSLLKAYGIVPTIGDGLSVKVARSSSGLFIGEDYYGNTAHSPNGQFEVAARDHSYDENNREIQGECALVDASGSILFRKSIRRANNPHVTNDGLVIVEDWKDEGLSGALLAFDVGGNRVWRRDFRANIHTSDVSEDGTNVFVTTCNGDYEAHSGKTFFLDAASGRRQWAVDGWGNVRFDGNQLVAKVSFPNESAEDFPFDSRGHLGPAYEDAGRRARKMRKPSK